MLNMTNKLYDIHVSYFLMLHIMCINNLLKLHISNMIISLGIMLEILHMIYKFNDTHVPYRQYDIVYIPYYTYFILQMLQI